MTAATTPTSRVRVALGLGRTHERRLVAACLADRRLRVAARCTSAPELLAAFAAGDADVALVDEDLHLLATDQLGELHRRRYPTVVLADDLEDDRWRGLDDLVVLARTADASEILEAAERAARRERPRSRATRAPRTAEPAVAPDVAASTDRLQVLALFGGPGAPGRTTLALSLGALLGTVAPTVVVDLDTAGASVAAHLHCREGVGANLVTLAEAAPDGEDAWERALGRALLPLGSFSPQASVLCGVPRPVLRESLSGGFVERLLATLRTRFPYILLDLGDEPVSGTGVESRVTCAALRAADHVLVAATPDLLGLHHARTALLESADLLDGARASLVLNRCDRHAYPRAEVEAALGLPVAAQLPVDQAAAQRALVASRPLVSDPHARVRRPLGELAERIVGGRVEIPTVVDEAAPSRWTRLRQLVAGVRPAMPGVAR